MHNVTRHGMKQNSFSAITKSIHGGLNLEIERERDERERKREQGARLQNI